MSFARGGRLRHELYIDVGTREETVEVFERRLADCHQIEARSHVHPALREALDSAWSRRLGKLGTT
jgi:hypothetical protein